MIFWISLFVVLLSDCNVQFSGFISSVEICTVLTPICQIPTETIFHWVQKMCMLQLVMLASMTKGDVILFSVSRQNINPSSLDQFTDIFIYMQWITTLSHSFKESKIIILGKIHSQNNQKSSFFSSEAIIKEICVTPFFIQDLNNFSMWSNYTNTWRPWVCWHRMTQRPQWFYFYIILPALIVFLLCRKQMIDKLYHSFRHQHLIFQISKNIDKLHCL